MTAPYRALLRRTHEVLEPARPGDRLSRAADIFIVALIGLNVVALVLESVPSVAAPWGPAFRAIEVVSVLAFTVEYLLRLWSGTAAPGYGHWLTGRLRTATRPLLIIDALAVLPFWLPMVGIDLRFLRALRMMRIFRILKVGRYSRAAQLVGRVLLRKKEELLVTMSVLGLLLIIGASLLYMTENPAQPASFSSIPAAMWWAVTTLSTVGYGDMYPITVAGRVIGAVVAILGIGMFALPAGILGGGFLEELGSRSAEPRRCPHCGEMVEP